jgi:hypothetical protein
MGIETFTPILGDSGFSGSAGDTNEQVVGFPGKLDDTNEQAVGFT